MLKGDHTQGVALGEFPLTYEAFDDKVASGPVPKFFSDEPSKSLDELKKSPEFAFGCLQALVSKLLERGDLSRYLKYN